MPTQTATFEGQNLFEEITNKNQQKKQPKIVYLKLSAQQYPENKTNQIQASSNQNQIQNNKDEYNSKLKENFLNAKKCNKLSIQYYFIDFLFIFKFFATF